MTAERNEATVRTWMDEAWNNGRVEGQAHIFSPVYHWDELPGGAGTGRDALFGFVTSFRAAFPDLHFTMDEVVADETTVAWRCTGKGTHRADFMGIPATGRSISVSAIIMSRFENGLWAEDHVVWDQLTMLQQLGVIPEQEPATA